MSLITRPHNPTSSSSSSSSSSHRSRTHLPTLTVRYRFRFVHPSGDRTSDETIPAPHDPPYSYSFTVEDEHEGAFVTHQSLHSRHIITGDTLILQVDMEVMQAQRTDFVFSHGLPIRGEGAEEEEKDVERVLGKQFLQAWRQGKDCDVYIRVKGGEEGGGGGGVDDDEEEEEKEEEEEDSAGSEDDTHKPPTRSHQVKKQRTSLTSSLPHTRTSIATVNLIPAHKFVLCSRSAVFAVMLSHDMRERKESVIEIDDIDRETVLRLLWFLYCGLLPDAAALTAVASASTTQKPSFQSSSRSSAMSSTSLLPPSILPTPITQWSEAVALYHSAHRYALPHLAELTAWSIVHHLSDDTVLPTLQLSECYREQSGSRTLFEAGKEWMCRRFEQVIRRTCDLREGGGIEEKKEVVIKGPREAKEREMKDRHDGDDLVDGCTVYVYADSTEDENRALASLSLSASSTPTTRITEPIALATLVNAKWSDGLSASPLALCLITTLLAPGAVGQVTLPAPALTPGTSKLKEGAVVPLRYWNLRLSGNHKSLVTSTSAMPSASDACVLSSSLANISIPESPAGVGEGDVPALSASVILSGLREGGAEEAAKRPRCDAGAGVREGGGKKRGRDDVPVTSSTPRLPTRSPTTPRLE